MFLYKFCRNMPTNLLKVPIAQKKFAILVSTAHFDLYWLQNHIIGIFHTVLKDVKYGKYKCYGLEKRVQNWILNSFKIKLPLQRTVNKRLVLTQIQFTRDSVVKYPTWQAISRGNTAPFYASTFITKVLIFTNRRCEIGLDCLGVRRDSTRMQATI